MLNSPYKDLNDLDKRLSKCIDGAIPESLDRAIRFEFNSALPNLMEGDSGATLKTVDHAFDLLVATWAMRNKNKAS